MLDVTRHAAVHVPGPPDLAPSTLDLAAVGSDWAGRGTNLSLAGAWDVTVQVQRGARTTDVPLTLVTPAPAQVTVPRPCQASPPCTRSRLPDGQQFQAYNDPGAAARTSCTSRRSTTHGKELPLADATIVATPSGGAAQVLDTRRFGAGHFVASVDLTAGPWHFDLAATAKDGTALVASFDETIGAQ